MINTEVPGQGPFFKVLNPWIENAPRVSMTEDAEEWFVVGIYLFNFLKALIKYLKMSHHTANQHVLRYGT